MGFRVARNYKQVIPNGLTASNFPNQVIRRAGGPLDENPRFDQLYYMRRPATSDFSFSNATSGQTDC